MVLALKRYVSTCDNQLKVQINGSNGHCIHTLIMSMFIFLSNCCGDGLAHIHKVNVMLFNGQSTQAGYNIKTSLTTILTFTIASLGDRLVDILVPF